MTGFDDPRSTAIAGRPSMTTTTGKWTQGACIVGVRRACIFIRPIAAGRDAGALCTVPEPRKDFDGSRRRARAEGAASLCRRWAMAPPSIPGAVRTNAAGQKGACGSPAAGLAATFPGSTQATEATKAGPEQPRYGAHPSASAHVCGAITREVGASVAVMAGSRKPCSPGGTDPLVPALAKSIYSL